MIDKYTHLSVGRFHGGPKHKKYYTDYETWRKQFEKHDVIVIKAKEFYNLLMHGFINMKEINLLIFDECHHTDQDNLYNLIMKDFYYL